MSAQYPTAVRTFATKNAGDTIQPADVNDVQDETNAVENGLLNGVAHPLSPDTDAARALGTSAKRWLLPSGTAAAPGVAIGATGVGPYSSGANALDFATAGIKALGIDSTQFIDSPTQPRCVAYNNAAQTVTAGNTTILTLNAEDVDVGAMHDPVTNNDRVTIPTGGDGYYAVVAFSQMQSSGGAAEMALQLKKNGATVLQENRFSVTAANLFAGATITWRGNLVAGDYLDLLGVAATNNVNFGSATRSQSTALSIEKLW